jgi:hypothetical protein
MEPPRIAQVQDQAHQVSSQEEQRDRIRHPRQSLEVGGRRQLAE